MTVSEFSKKFKTPLVKLLLQLQDAGISNKKENDILDAKEIQKLMLHRRAKNTNNKKTKLTLDKTRLITKSGKKKVTISVQGGKVAQNKSIKKPTSMQATADKQKHQKLYQELKEKQQIETEQNKKQKIKEQNDKISQKKPKQTLIKKQKTNQKTDEKKHVTPKTTVDTIIDKIDKKEDLKTLEKELTSKKPKKKKHRRGVKKRNEIDIVLAKRDKLHISPEKIALHNKNKKQKTTVDIEAKHEFSKPSKPQVKEIKIYNHNDVRDLAEQMAIKVGDVIKTLMKMGVMSTVNQSIDRDTATLLVEELEHTAKQESDDNQLEKEVIENINKTYTNKITRSPIVTVMGHVDHGKTSLLDYIRKTRVQDSESGGITQHIGAYHVETKKGIITFLDTPGHSAFSAMRARGADLTDIIVLIVAADDGVKPQTIEAIQHAKEASVPIIVAVNKIDKENANVEKIKQELSKQEIISEDWGGENIFVAISAKTGEGIDDLLDNIILQAEVMELQGFKTGAAQGTVIEATLDKGRGVMTTLLVQNGTLQRSDIVVAGFEYGKVRSLLDENHHQLQSAGPAIPVVMLGFSSAPVAGNRFMVVKNEKQARELCSIAHSEFKKDISLSTTPKNLDDFFNKKQTDKTLNILVKADTHGSYEAIKQSLEEIKDKNNEITVKVFGGIGGIKESDVSQAVASGAIIFGFNVRADNKSRLLIDKNKLDLHYYSVIYELIEEVKAAASGLLSPQIKETIIGTAKVQEVFRSQKLGDIAGCMVVDGKIKISAPIRVLRDDVVIFEGELESLRRFKDEVKEVNMGTECGIGVKDYNDIKPDDKIEVYERHTVKQTI
jgi:translation initiation factor IF-2